MTSQWPTSAHTQKILADIRAQHEAWLLAVKSIIDIAHIPWWNLYRRWQRHLNRDYALTCAKFGWECHGVDRAVKCGASEPLLVGAYMLIFGESPLPPRTDYYTDCYEN